MNLAHLNAIPCPLIFIRVCIAKRELSTMTAEAPSNVVAPPLRELANPKRSPKASEKLLSWGLHAIGVTLFEMPDSGHLPGTQTEVLFASH